MYKETLEIHDITENIYSFVLNEFDKGPVKYLFSSLELKVKENHNYVDVLDGYAHQSFAHRETFAAGILAYDMVDIALWPDKKAWFKEKLGLLDKENVEINIDNQVIKNMARLHLSKSFNKEYTKRAMETIYDKMKKRMKRKVLIIPKDLSLMIIKSFNNDPLN